MSTTEPNTATQVPETRSMDLKLEVAILPVSDADRAKQFYASLGWREDADFVLSDDLRTNVQPDRAPTAEEPPPAARVDDRPAPGCDHPGQLGTGVDGAEGLDGRPLTSAESGLALGLEDLRNAHARLALDLLVEVDERRVVTGSDTPPNRGLAAARQPDDDELHA